MGRILTGQSTAPGAVEAVKELYEQLWQPDAELVVFFCAPTYDLEAVAAEIDRLFGDVPVLGCTTAGEIGPLGYLDGSISGFCLPSSHFATVSGRFGNLAQFNLEQGREFVVALLGRLEAAALLGGEGHVFAFQLIDGMSVREELVTRVFQHALGSVPLMGGSAGDGQSFGHTFVFNNGAFHEDSAVLVVGATSLPFTVFSAHPFVGTEGRVVVTGADPATRRVVTVNGLPAAEEYARLIGVSPNELEPSLFAAHPVVVRIGGSDYARSIQRANPDGSLTFYCAIDEGIVLRVADSGDFLADLEQAFERVRNEIGEPSLVITCDCILRNIELTRLGIKPKVAELYRQNRAVGLSTYGEQLHGIHVNQTLTGIAFGEGAEKGDA